MAKEPAPRLLASNRKALHDYHVLDSFEAGIALTGTEVKAARQGKVQLKDSHVELRDGEAWLIGVHVSPYSHGNRQNHDPERPRKLLLSRRELERLYGQTQIKGLSVVPLEVYLKGPWIKTRIALVRGKKLYDKREAEKRKTQEREMRAALSERLPR
ncbi:MAG TPA: SsrA-binding protein SmpB [Thermoanaerobaculia bacterium]|nr:SsrA-binding protein SmpB [Thermoanaerobaculia bacterium]